MYYMYYSMYMYYSHRLCNIVKFHYNEATGETKNSSQYKKLHHIQYKLQYIYIYIP